MLESAPPVQNLFASFGNEKSRIDYKILKELDTERYVFVYNGLIYNYNPELNLFVNQYENTMSVDSAIDLAIYMGYDSKIFKNYKELP